MFFILSKTLAFFTFPSNVLILLLLAGAVLLFTRFWRAGRTLLVLALAAVLVFGFLPTGKLLFSVLENRFPAWSAARGAPAGFIVLGGSIDPDTSAVHGNVALTDAAERLTVVPDLIRRYPTARIIFTGGNGTLFGADAEAPFAAKLFESLGIPAGRVEFEGQSRNTLENALLSKALAAPKADERWVVVTSAYHMPRAIAAFRNAGFEVEAYPVDWQFAGPQSYLWPGRSIINGMAYTDWAVREFIGLAVYRLTGRSHELFPAPR
jgi:uncharacterized SAM-binding protein YcdF (DUF218 family)